MTIATLSVSICHHNEANSEFDCTQIYARFAGLGLIMIAHLLFLWDTAPRTEFEETYTFK